MLLAFIFSSMVAISFCLPMTKTPLHLGLFILLLAIFNALFVTMVSSTWFGLILVIIYIGGMLVMFAYFIAIIPNQNFSSKPIMYTIFLSLFFFFFFSDTMIWSSIFISNEDSQILATTLFYSSHGPILIALVLILFFALLAVVKISERNKGPFRPFFSF